MRWIVVQREPIKHGQSIRRVRWTVVQREPIRHSESVFGPDRAGLV
ncbi:MAG: hypothetical protein PVH95_12925 [Anaerolineae bacterium]